MHSTRLLVDWWHGRARPGMVEVIGGVALNSAAHRTFGVAQIWHASCRSPRRGEAREGSAQLKVAVPSSPTVLSESRKAADLIPMIDTSDKSLPGPAEPKPRATTMINT